MNYLISAYSINPNNGSEDGVGWNWLLQYEKNYKEGDKIILLTKKYNEDDTVQGMKENDIQHVELVVVDVPRYLNWFREKYSIFHHMYYILWQHWAWKWVKKSDIKFDIIHHVTMGDYRFLGKMWKVKEAYSILGPVGGAQITPKSLKRYEKNRIFSYLREIVNKSCNINPFYHNAINKFNLVVASNIETYNQLYEIIINKDRLIKMVELGIQMPNDKKKLRESRNSDTVELIFVGRLIAKKGIYFLMDVIEKIPRNIKYQLSIYGDGPLKTELEHWIEKCNLTEKVVCKGNISHKEMLEKYKDADIFLITSLRETGGTVLLEAMENLLPIVGFNASFCAELAQYKCGLFVDVKQPLENIINDFQSSLLTLILNENMRNQLGRNGEKYAETLTWENKYSYIVGRAANEIKSEN